MAESKRLTRTYHFNRVIYTPDTPSDKVPDELWEREKQLDSPEFKEKKARRYGNIVATPIKHLVPETTGEVVEEEEEPSPVKASSGGKKLADKKK